ncbi:MAG: hypothetical protein KJ621_11005 [Proteobacteria bacterium]|nr:hypothetical protein [Pseudomonadota bacterium]MBU1740282.1 hypothetical protein [Pseudomonadota bacterium]
MTAWRQGMVALLYVFLWLALCGMGDGGAALKGPIRIPTPAKQFTVTLTDRQAVTTRLTYFSAEGMIFFTGTRGLGQMALAFDRVRSIEFRFKDKKLTATATLKNGSKVDFVIDRGQRVMGKVAYGNYRIELAHVRRIVFH